MTATGRPVSASLTMISPEMYGRPFSLFAGYPPTHLSVTTSSSRR